MNLSYQILKEDIFDIVDDSSEIHLHHDNKTGLKAIVAIHSTKLGPTLGGCRCVPYAASYQAIEDALLLARAMTFKSAIAEVPFSGGKAVLINNQPILDRKAYFTEYGKFVDSLQGKYITAVDSGTDLDDMDIVAQQTKYVSSTSAMGSSPAQYTALGVYNGIKSSVKYKLKTDKLTDLHISVQGIGAVGMRLCEMLAADGAKLTVTDIDPKNLQYCEESLGATVVEPKDIFSVKADVFCPNALGAIINDETIEQLQVSIIAGAANNQLAKETIHSKILMEKGILYAPDYVINAGGLIFAANKYLGATTEMIEQKVKNIYNSLEQIFSTAIQENICTFEVANNLAAQKLADKN
ncbi:MAG: amino acid dehydrogenase [Legionellales bacterium]|nr:amino acid dehydrogenase [Legionellales bacterium]